MSTLPRRTATNDVAALTRLIRLLVAVTISYNTLEAAVAIAAGVGASSIALMGFGIDSVIEVCSAAALAWQFSAREATRRAARERVALRVTALSFFALSGYLVVEGLHNLVARGEARHSAVGIALAALSLLVMPLVSSAQRRAGRRLGSASAIADSRQTMLCTYLSAVLLLGLLANSLFGWAWADPVAGLVIAVVAGREGVQAWRGEACCVVPVPAGALDDRRPATDESAAAGCECRAAVPERHAAAGTRWRRSGAGNSPRALGGMSGAARSATTTDCCR